MVNLVMVDYSQYITHNGIFTTGWSISYWIAHNFVPAKVVDIAIWNGSQSNVYYA